MKRAERERRERALEEGARNRGERLALKALLDRRIAAHGEGPTGVTHLTDVVRRYALVIAWRIGGDAQGIQQHFAQLIGKE